MKNFREFSDEWIEENVDSELYSGMKDEVREFVALFIRLRHSGVSASLFMFYIWKLMTDYTNQKVSK